MADVLVGRSHECDYPMSALQVLAGRYRHSTGSYLGCALCENSHHARERKVGRAPCAWWRSCFPERAIHTFSCAAVQIISSYIRLITFVKLCDEVLTLLHRLWICKQHAEQAHGPTSLTGPPHLRAAAVLLGRGHRRVDAQRGH